MMGGKARLFHAPGVIIEKRTKSKHITISYHGEIVFWEHSLLRILSKFVNNSSGVIQEFVGQIIEFKVEENFN